MVETEPTIQQRLRNARGTHYGTLYKQVYYGPVGQALFVEARDLITLHGDLKVWHLGVLMVHHDLPCATVCKLLEDAEILPCGTWQRLQDRGLKVRDVVAAACRKLGIEPPAARQRARDGGEDRDEH